MSFHILRHVPSFCEGVERLETDVELVADLDRVEWIRAWRDDAGFWRFSWANERRPLRLAEFEEGRRWWVVGYLSAIIPDLPRALFDTPGSAIGRRFHPAKN